MNYKIICKTLDEYILSITITQLDSNIEEHRLTDIQSKKLKYLYIHSGSPLPLDYFQLLVQKELPISMINEINDVIQSGGSIDWFWLLEIVEFHSNLSKK